MAQKSARNARTRTGPPIPVVLLLGLSFCLSGCGLARQAQPVAATDTALPQVESTVPSAPSPAASPAPAYDPTYESTECPVPIPPSYQVECGTLTVPEDRGKPKGPTVRLPVALFRSRAAEPAPDPVVHLVGGPGGNLLGAISFYLEAGGDAFLEHRDYLLFNQRGTRYAEPSLFCPGQEHLRTDLAQQDLDYEERQARELDFLQDCRDYLVQQGINLAAYNSAENAADLNDLRLALGYEQINLYGISYGTRLALTLLRDHPDGVRSVILDSVYPPQVALDAEVGPNAHRAFGILFQDCAGDSECSQRYPTLQETFYSVIDELNAEPASVHVDAYNVDAHLDGHLFLELLFGTMYRTSALPWVPTMIDAARQGNYEPLQTPLSVALDESNLSLGMYYALQCGEEVAFESYERALEAVQALPSQLADHYASRFIFDLCEAWPAGRPDPRENEPVYSDLPVLILSGQYDPITPPEWGRLAAATLSRSQFYEFPGVGHGVMRSSQCGLEIGLQFLNDPDAEPDVFCLTTLTAPEFR